MRRVHVAGLIGLCILLACQMAGAVTNLKHGMDAPKIILKDLESRIVDTSQRSDRILVLIFGEIYHPKTQQACVEIEKILKSEHFRDDSVEPILIVTQAGTAEQLRQEARKQPLPSIIVRDVERQAFEAYQVVVMPSVVVVDRKGKVVHAIAAYTSQFAHVFENAVALATGELDAETFDQRMKPHAEDDNHPNRVRAERLTQLARQLAQRGLEDMAMEKYAEALELDPKAVQPHLGLGMLQLKRQHLPEAESQFKIVLASEPDSLEASLGLAYVYVLRGGEELGPAEKSLRALLEKNRNEPRVYYLLGRIHEQRSEYDQAASQYKKSAQMLMERMQWEVTP